MKRQAYPILVYALASGVLLLSLCLLLPRIELMMKGMGHGMPFLTTLLINTANFAVHWAACIILGGLLIFLMARISRK